MSKQGLASFVGRRATLFNVLQFEPLLGLSIPPGRGRRASAGGSADWHFNSREAVAGRIARSLSGYTQVNVKVTSWGKSAGHVRDHVRYITRNGEIEAEDEFGRLHPNQLSTRDALNGWFRERDPRRPAKRESMHLVLSMPHGTDPGKVLAAARKFSAREFRGRQYLLALHSEKTDRRLGHGKHPHVHLVVKSLDDAGLRLHVGPHDLWRYREVFAEELRNLGVRATNAPALERLEVKRERRSRKQAELLKANNIRRNRQWRARAEEAMSIALRDRPLDVSSAERRRKADRALAIQDYRLAAEVLRRSASAADQALANQIREFVVRAQPAMVERENAVRVARQQLKQQLASERYENRNGISEERTR